MFDIPGKVPTRAAAKLKLLSHKLMPGGVIWARYRVIDQEHALTTDMLALLAALRAKVMS